MIFAGIMFLMLILPTYILGQPRTPTDPNAEQSIVEYWKDFWVFRLTLNVMGYAVIMVPSYILIRYIKKTNYGEIAGESYL